MSDRLITDGIVSVAKLCKSANFPSAERLDKGAVAIIECFQEIPCDPCEHVCPKKAVKVGKPITNLPRFLQEKCDGCGICVAHCPGLAIFVVDLTYSKDEGVVEFPYEFLPLPDAGDEVDAVDREGKVISKGKIKGVRNPRAFDHTALISLIVPKELAMEIRSIRISQKSKVQSLKSKINDEVGIKVFQSRPRTSDLGPWTTVVCRCEEVLESEIEKAIEEGSYTPKEIKDKTRTGMGLCQGRFCTTLSTQLISEKTNIPLRKIGFASVRPPVRPIDLGSLAAGREND